MQDVKDIIVSIEAIAKERDNAQKEKQELQVKIFQLESELKKQKKETDMWRNIVTTIK